MVNWLKKVAPPGRWVLDPASSSLILIGLILLILTAIGCSTRYASSAAAGIKIRPASGDLARLQRNAHYYQLMGRPELALKEMEEARRRDPGNLKLADALAQCYEQAGRGDQARQIYREVLARDKDNGAIENNLCYSYYLTGNFRQAETCFRQTLARHPNNTQARNNLGLVLCRQGRQEEARRLWEETEGPALAAKKVRQVLASLGTAVPAPAAVEPVAAAPSPPRSAPPVSLAAAAPPTAAEPAVTPPVSGASGPGPGEPTRKSAAADHVPIAAMLAPPSPDASSAGAPPPAGSFQPVEASRDLAAREGETPQLIKSQAPRTGTVSGPVTVSKPDRPETRAPAATPVQGPERPAQEPLTCRELVETAIEVRNGNGTPDLARETRSSLDLEGFTVVAIANHIDFGMEKTVIYYRPGAERVARTLNHKFFPNAQMETGKKLGNDVDIRIVLGHDFTPQYADTGDQAKQKTL